MIGSRGIGFDSTPRIGTGCAFPSDSFIPMYPRILTRSSYLLYNRRDAATTHASQGDCSDVNALDPTPSRRRPEDEVTLTTRWQ